jgi:predicted GIY-YIG superfamily endonuclease
MMKNEKTTLYRYFDSAGVLLYVGITSDQFQRIKQHSRHAKWFYDAVRCEIEHYESREAALEAERTAIINEEPLFNLIHSKNMEPWQDHLASLFDVTSDIATRDEWHESLVNNLKSVDISDYAKLKGFDKQVAIFLDAMTISHAQEWMWNDGYSDAPAMPITSCPKCFSMYRTNKVIDKSWERSKIKLGIL